jgi:ribosome biogenesis GTPase
VTYLDQFGWKGARPNAILGRVVKEFQHIYHVITDHTGERLETKVTGQFRHAAQNNADYPVVGDFVTLKQETHNHPYFINSVLPRHNKLSRKHKHYNNQEQVIVSNIDIAIVMISAQGYRQDNHSRLNRFIHLAVNANISPIVILNKTDLVDDPDVLIATLTPLVSPYPVIPTQAKFNLGTDAVDGFITNGQTGIIIGMSGVGKSTLVNALMNQTVQSVHEVRNKDFKGMHTTRNRELFQLPSGGLIIDTPGIKALSLWEAEFDNSITTKDSRFDSILETATECKFSNCTHQHEPKCAVKLAVENGVINASLFALYLKSSH